MNAPKSDYALIKLVSSSYEETIAAIREALATQGFGILTEIDVSATLKKKLDADFPRTIILGACNPTLAHRALTAVPDISVLLPCNVVVRETDEGSVEVAALKPTLMQNIITDSAELESVAKEAEQRVLTAMDTLS